MDILSPRDEHETRQALGLLVERPGLTQDKIDAQVDTLLSYTRRRQISLEHCLIARENDRVLGVCLCVDSAGRMSTIFIPAQRRFLVPPAAIIRLLGEQARLARLRQVQLLQATVLPEDTIEADVYRAAGFQYLARLIYMDSDLNRAIRPPQTSLQVDWITYQEDTHSLFARVVQSTYEGSLDCVGLNGVRDIEDILASHKATGVFDPRHWLIATVDGEPTGVILLSRLPERWAMEVVYMGVLPSWRGRTCGVALLRHAVDLARREALSMLTLSVDVGNLPALRLYERFGFRETARRDVWLRRT